MHAVPWLILFAVNTGPSLGEQTAQVASSSQRASLVVLAVRFSQMSRLDWPCLALLLHDAPRYPDKQLVNRRTIMRVLGGTSSAYLRP